MNNEAANRRKEQSNIKSLLNQSSVQLRMEENIMHFLSQLQPLRLENADLKNTILASQNYLEQQRNDLSNIIRETESRGLIKRIADFPTLIDMLRSDMTHMQETLERQTQQLDEQTTLLKVLNEERDTNYQKIKLEVSEQAILQEKIIQQQSQMITSKDEVISQLNLLVEDENTKIKKNQNNHFEIVDSYNEKVEQLVLQLNEEIEKEDQLKKKYTQLLQQQQVDHQTQVAIKQDQYEFALGELRNTYEKRMDKLIKDSEFRISEATKTSIRANKEIEQLRNKYDQELQKSEQQISFIKNLQLQLQQQQQQTSSYRNQMQQQQLYLHQTQAIIGNLKKNNLLTQANEDQILQLELPAINDNQLSQSFSNEQIEKQNLEYGEQEQQTSPSLFYMQADMSNFSPSTFKLTVRNADKLTTQCTPTQQRMTEDKITNFNLESCQPQKQSYSLSKKLRKRKHQKSQNRENSENYRVYTNDCLTPKHFICGQSPKQSEETPNSKFVSVNFTQAVQTHSYNLRRRSKLQINYSNNEIQEQEIYQIQTEDASCQTDDILIDCLIMNENQKSLNTQQLERISLLGKNQIINTDNNNMKNQHQFSLQILQSDQDEQQNQKDEELSQLKDQIKQLQQQNSFQRKSIIELQDNTSKIEETLKENMKQMQQQISKSQTENEALLKQLSRPKELSKKKIDMQQHLEGQMVRNDTLQDQLTKAAEVIKYFNQELENYKQAYNIFGQGSKSERQKQKLPSLYQPSPKRKLEKKQYSMHEETQRLIENLYHVAPARLKRN